MVQVKGKVTVQLVQVGFIFPIQSVWRVDKEQTGRGIKFLSLLYHILIIAYAGGGRKPGGNVVTDTNIA